MKKTSKILALSLVFTLGLGVSELTDTQNLNNTSYAEELIDYDDLLKKEYDGKDEFMASEIYQNANDAKKKIYELNIEHAKEYLDGNTVGDNAKSIYQEIIDTKEEIKTNEFKDVEEMAKVRVSTRLEIQRAKEVIDAASNNDKTLSAYNKLCYVYYDALDRYKNKAESKSDYKAIYEDVNKAIENLENAKTDAYKNSLVKAIEENKKQSKFAKDLLKNYPNTVEKIKGQLEELVKTSEEMVKKAESILASL